MVYKIFAKNTNNKKTVNNTKNLHSCQKMHYIKWKLKEPRYLVFLERGLCELRMPFPPKDDGGENVHRGNELP